MSKVYRIGVSELPYIYGISPFMSTKEWFEKKLADIKTETNFAMDKGNFLEDDILEIFSKYFQVGKVVHNKDKEMFSVMDGRFVCVPDGWIEVEESNSESSIIPLEAKFTTRRDLLNNYVLQLTAELAIMNASHGYLLIMTPETLCESHPSKAIEVMCVERDEKVEKEIYQNVEFYLSCLDKGEMPETIKDEAYFIYEQNETDDHSIVIPDGGIDELCEKYDELSNEIEGIKKIQNEIKKKLECMAGGKDYIRGYKYGYKKISYTKEPSIEISTTFSDLLKRYNIPFILNEPKTVSYYKIVKIKGKE